MNKKPFPDSRDLNQMQGYWFGAFPHTSQWLITPRVHNTKRFQRSSDHTFEKWTSKAYTRQIKAHPSVKSSVRKVNIKTLPVTPQKREKKNQVNLHVPSLRLFLQYSIHQTLRRDEHQPHRQFLLSGSSAKSHLTGSCRQTLCSR